MAFSILSIQPTAGAISLIIISICIFFLNSPPTPHDHSSQSPLIPRRSLINSTTSTAHQSCSSILQTPPHDRCYFSLNYCESESSGLINYYSLHYCLFYENPHLSLPFLALALLLQFYILVKTAQDRFSVVVTKLCTHLSLSPSMGAVTLLALGNGAPDVFASLAAVRSGHPRTGFGAILSAGTFVSALVVGFVGIHAAPFSVNPAPFIRDVMFYLIAAFFLFYVYLSGELYFWQAIGFVGYYLFFVGIVFWMDLGSEKGKDKNSGGKYVGEVNGYEEVGENLTILDCENGNAEIYTNVEGSRPGSGRTFAKISKVWEVPVNVLLRLTIPETAPCKWSRFYQSANIVFCPLALLYASKSIVDMGHPVIFLIPRIHFPLWMVVTLSLSSLATLHYMLEREPPKTEQMPVVLVAFVMSVFWISTAAGELLNCLAALGAVLKLPPSLLGLTVLAWGNSVGDLVADVAVAKAGQPAMAMAGCFAGPMFNMLVGLGTALVIQTAEVYPEAYRLNFHISIIVAFVFLFLSLMGSLLVITWCRFRVPRFWGFCLVGLYVLFIVVSLLIAGFST